jgi:hypothetical protein
MLFFLHLKDDDFEIFFCIEKTSLEGMKKDVDAAVFEVFNLTIVLVWNEKIFKSF